MWFFPTRQRPLHAQRLLNACVATGMTSPGVLVIDGDSEGYDDLRIPNNIVVMTTGEHLEFCGVLNWCVATFPVEPFYGWVGDDSIPRTPEWDKRLESASEHWGVGVSNDLMDSHHLGWWTPGATDGKLIRALGWWALPGLVHLYIDDVWHYLDKRLGLIRPLRDVIIEEFHFSNGKGDFDNTYKRVFRGEPYASKDADAYRQWVSDPATELLIERMRVLRGT